MTLTDAFHRFLPTLLRTALKELLKSVNSTPFPEIALVGDIIGVDGGYFPIMGGLQLIQRTDTSRIKLHRSFDLRHYVPIDFVVGDTPSNKRAALRTTLHANAIYILNRGYMAFAVMRDCINAHAHIIMRAYNNTIETVKELLIDVPQVIKDH